MNPKRTRRGSRSELREATSAKGWSLSNLACRWGVTIRHLSRVFSGDEIDQRWIDAVNGLPVLSRMEARLLTGERLAIERASSATAKQQDVSQEGSQTLQEDLIDRPILTDYLKPGAILVSLESSGAFEDGDEWVIAEVRASLSGDYMIAVRQADANELVWFSSEEELWSHMAETGRVEDE